MQLDRLLGILTILLQTDRVTAPDLAKRFEVHRRTIHRDIDTLCRAGIPIITLQGTGGGISIAEGFKLDKSILSVDELSEILSAIKGLGSVSESSKTENILCKLQVKKDSVISMREPIIIDLASHYKGQLTEKIHVLKSAILDNRCVEFDYIYDKGTIHRCIEPYYIVFRWTSWYVFGFCSVRKDWRMFKLLRLWNLKTLPDTFVPVEVPLEKQDFSTVFPDNQKLVALFDASEKYRLIETYGPDCYTETKEGLLLEIGYTTEDFIVSWILGFGSRVKVIEPVSVKERIIKIAENICFNYK